MNELLRRLTGLIIEGNASCPQYAGNQHVSTDHVKHFSDSPVSEVSLHALIGPIRCLDKIHDFVRKSEGALLGLTEATRLSVSFFKGGEVLIGYPNAMCYQYVLAPGIQTVGS